MSNLFELLELSPSKLCVYGTLRKGFPAHNKIKDSVFFEGTTWIPGFEMVSLGAFPGVLRTKNPNPTIFGEVYSFAADILPELDAYEGCPGFYQRHKIDTVYGPAWIYVLPNEDRYESLPRIINGKWEHHE